MLLAACGGVIQPEGVLPPPSFEPDAGVEANVVIQVDADMTVSVAGALEQASLKVEGVDSLVKRYYLATVGTHAVSVQLSGASVYEGTIEVGDTDVTALAIDAAGDVKSVTVDAGASITTQLNNNLDLAGKVWYADGVSLADVRWEVVDGPGIVTLANPAVPATAVSFENTGRYVLRLTASVGDVEVSDDVSVDVKPYKGTIYYVATDGSDRNSGTSAASPFKTLNKAGRMVRAGDIIRVRGGTYHEYNTGQNALGLPLTPFTTSGTRDAPIVIESYPGELAVFDGTYYPNGKKINVDAIDTTPQSPALLAIQGSHYVVRNLEFRYAAGAGVTTGSSSSASAGSYNAFVNLHTHHNHGDGLTAAGASYLSGTGAYLDRPVVGNLAEFVVSHNNGSTRNDGNSADGIKFSHNRKGVIRYSLLFKNSDDGMDFIGSKDMLVEHTAAWLNGWFWPEDDFDPYSMKGAMEAATGDGNGFKMGGRSSGTTSGNVVRNSVAWGNKVFGFTHNSAGGVSFYNNTSFDNGNGGFAARCYKTNVLRNNLSYDESNTIGSTASSCPRGVWVDSSDNSWDLGITSPRFISTTPGDAGFLQLDAKSKAIDAGVDVGLAYSGRKPDLGAIEIGRAVEGAPEFPQLVAQRLSVAAASVAGR